jgi:hypothetical protein
MLVKISELHFALKTVDLLLGLVDLRFQSFDR